MPRIKGSHTIATAYFPVKGDHTLIDLSPLPGFGEMRHIDDLDVGRVMPLVQSSIQSIVIDLEACRVHMPFDLPVEGCLNPGSYTVYVSHDLFSEKNEFLTRISGKATCGPLLVVKHGLKGEPKNIKIRELDTVTTVIKRAIRKDLFP